MAEEFNNPINQENITAESSAPPQKEKFVIRPLRTYEEDVANFVKRGQISTAKIIAAEQQRQRETETIQEVDKTKKKMTLIALSSVILIIIAGLILWWVFSVMNSGDDKTSPDRPSNFRDVLIDKKGYIEISTDYKVGSEVKTQVIQNIDVPPTDLENNEIEELLLTKTVSETVNGKITKSKQKLAITEVFTQLELNPEESFTRALGENYLLGLMNLDGETFPIILIKTLEYERVFSGLLSWERALYREINDIFFKTLGRNDFINPAADENSFDPTKFVDKIFYNRDVRAIEDKNGKVLFYYTFVNNDYILLSSNTAAIQSLAAKLNLQNIVR